MIYTHVLKLGGGAVRSPLDLLRLGAPTGPGLPAAPAAASFAAGDDNDDNDVCPAARARARSPLRRPAVLPRYAELHCRSNFSFLTGASHPEELVMRAAALGYGALAITDECSLAGVVRAHLEAKAQQLHLVVGSEMRLVLPGGSGAAHARLVLLAMSRRGYGNLSHWITVARRRAAKGSYLAHPGDVEGKVPNAPTLAGLPECLALLVPSAAQPFEDVFAHAMWLKTWFQDRAAIALELLHRAGDDELVDRVVRVAGFTGLPIVAAGDVLMHVRSRKPLQDTLTATRLARPVAECGLALEPNAEQHLRSRGRLAALYEPEWLENTMVARRPLRLLARRAALRIPAGDRARGRDAGLATCASSPTPACRRRFPHGLPDALPRARSRASSPLIAELKYEAYFLTVADIVRWARAQRHPLPGPRQRRQLAGLLLPRASPRSTRGAPRCSSAASSASSATSRPTSTSTSSTSAARRSSSTSTASTAGTAPRSPRWSSATGRARRCATSAARSASTCSASTRSRRASTGSTAARIAAERLARARLRPRRAGRAACGWSSPRS